MHEAKTKFKDNITLNSLYTSILQGAFGDEDSDNDPNVRLVLWAAVLTVNPLSPSTIALFLGLDTEDVFPLLSSAQSLFTFQQDFHYPVQPFHKSSPDFITHPDRCTNKRFHVSPPSRHSQLLIYSLNFKESVVFTAHNFCDMNTNLNITNASEKSNKSQSSCR